MNSTIETILQHRSIRKFKAEKLGDEQINTIVDAASRASTSSYMMAFSIIGVKDQRKKKILAEISNQPYVQENGHLLLFCADLYRNSIHADDKQYESMLPNLENTEHFLVASIDAALAAQNAAIAAESLGLGICYIGSIRNNIQLVNDTFDLPQHVIPLFGLAIGVPNHSPETKPRLPKEAFYFEDNYVDKSKLGTELEEFDQTIKQYYENRSSNKRIDSWTKQMVRVLSNEKRTDVGPFIQSKQYNRR
ncbi:oxygen-insensitive NADPH nitroreductase [Aquibacillus koreensis]|uniref:Oxygen-insensitive NADPH nitroreductase n=1 Tax=Aquibacillus koreensis TaxID=279446 RepID=A0A9X4AJT3_9BACI|nr:oxygen-insensitive NADPH nitroreductase [Aquibacillus koreensis]MCT2534347.1 oxygen-insensitive NADPH nitroreductase [Aquibacillus koreensis]MDC3420668.1 oxygen-insensitive NADPH nitroreductase [Aquibacillus koreensis]